MPRPGLGQRFCAVNRQLSPQGDAQALGQIAMAGATKDDG
jgi:hypothetical protein